VSRREGAARWWRLEPRLAAAARLDVDLGVEGERDAVRALLRLVEGQRRAGACVG
jgi:hypothetical protein